MWLPSPGSTAKFPLHEEVFENDIFYPMYHFIFFFSGFLFLQFYYGIHNAGNNPVTS